ncbi:MAG: AAA family ATPase [Bacteroidota bacterium]
MYIQINDDFDKELENAEYYDANHDEKLVSFGPVSTINLFVGANNSGKSRFLRQIIKNAGIYFTSSKFNLRKKALEISPEINVANMSGTNFSIKIKRSSQVDFSRAIPSIKRMGLIKLEDFFVNKNGNEMSLDAELFRTIVSAITEAKNRNYDELKELLEDKESIEKLEIVYEITKNKLTSSSFPFLIITGYSEKYRSDVESCYKAVNTFLATSILKNSYQTIYIPILRTANSLFEEYSSPKKHSNDIFKHTVAINYQLNDKGTHGNSTIHEIFTGLGLYKKLKRERNSKKHIRDRIDAFEKFLSEKFFHNKPVEIVAEEADSPKNEHIAVYLDGKELPVHSLGDGIQSLIILLYPMFMAEPETWIFIEEPEINLHPGMQRIFLEQLTKTPLKENKLKYFITTHSNHLLDLSLEMGKETAIFTFDKKISAAGKASFEIKNVKSGDTDVLNLLGVKNSSVFMANCTIWVEGITDRYYIREFLKAYHKKFNDREKFKEDLHYAFFEYAGTNVMHYIFDEPEKIEDDPKIKAQLLSNKIFLISDKDIEKDKKHQLFEKQENKNFHYEVLGVKEIENIFSEIQLKAILPKLFDTIAGEDLEKVKFEFEKYKGDYLGKYLKTKFKAKIMPAYLSESSSLSTYYKNKLADIIKEEGFIKWEEMSEPAKELTQNIYTFIEKANS